MGTVDYGMPKDMQPTEGRVTVCAWGAITLSGDNSVSWMPFSESNGSAVWIGTKLVAYNGSDSGWDPNTGNPTSNLHGWLKPASTDAKDNATWVDSDMLRVQTRSKGDTPTTNTIVLGDDDAYRDAAAGRHGRLRAAVPGSHGGGPPVPPSCTR